MKDAIEDWTRPGDTLIQVKWDEKQQVLRMIEADQEIGKHLSDPFFVGSASSLGLVVDSDATMGVRAQFWKPEPDRAPVYMDMKWKREIGKRILALISPVSLDPLVEWILVWPRDQREVEFDKVLAVRVADGPHLHLGILGA